MDKRLRVLGTEYRVKEVNPKVLKDAWADCDAREKVIRMGRGLPALQRQEALLHELMHAIEAEYGFEMNHDHLTLMARGIRFVVLDNPGLAQEIFEKES